MSDYREREGRWRGEGGEREGRWRGEGGEVEGRGRGGGGVNDPHDMHKIVALLTIGG